MDSPQSGSPVLERRSTVASGVSQDAPGVSPTATHQAAGPRSLVYPVELMTITGVLLSPIAHHPVL